MPCASAHSVALRLREVKKTSRVTQQARREAAGPGLTPEGSPSAPLSPCISASPSWPLTQRPSGAPVGLGQQGAQVPGCHPPPGSGSEVHCWAQACASLWAGELELSPGHFFFLAPGMEPRPHIPWLSARHGHQAHPSPLFRRWTRPVRPRPLTRLLLAGALALRELPEQQVHAHVLDVLFELLVHLGSVGGGSHTGPLPSLLRLLPSSHTDLTCPI